VATVKNHDCKTELKKALLKVTPARLGVLSALENSNTPIDALDILSYLKHNQIKANRVTVFRIINALAEKGIATPIQFNDGKTRYEHESKIDHHHLVCESCGNTEDISDCSIPMLESEIMIKRKFLIKRHSLEFFGLCQNCQL